MQTFLINGWPSRMVGKATIMVHNLKKYAIELFVFVFLAVMIKPAAAGDASGVVTDVSTNQPIAGAVVILWETSDTTTTNAAGEYFFSAVPADGFTLVAGLSGYEPAVKRGDCDCGNWGDVTCDGAINPVDVVFMVNYVYKNWQLLCAPPNCPRTAGDVNCDDNVNPVDVVYYVNFVYKNWGAFCSDPCTP